jgi:hypothetical protein
MVSIVLIIYFSLPAAVVAGYFCREATGGLFDSLFSIPGTVNCLLACLPAPQYSYRLSWLCYSLQEWIFDRAPLPGRCRAVC